MRGLVAVVGRKIRDPADYRLLRPTAGARNAIWSWQALIERLRDDPPELLATALPVSSTEELT
jgi:hypothetical protein